MSTTNVGELVVQLGLDNSGLTGGLGVAAHALSAFGGQAPGLLAPIAVGAAVAGAAVVGIGIASVKAAGDFQAGLTSLVTSAGESADKLKMVGDGIQQLSVETGTSTQQLISGMYMIESSGKHGAEGLQILRAAAMGARAENADLGVVSNALTSVLTNYHLPASRAVDVTNALVATVASGKTHMQDLAGSMSASLPIASALGISFPNVAAAIATMTNSGESAQQASQNLGNAIRSLAAPNAIAVKSMKSVGIGAQELHDALTHQGLDAAIQMVSDHVGKTFPAGSVAAVNAFKHIMGGATGYNVALMLGGQNMASYEANIKSISAAMNAGSHDVAGWSDIQGNFNFKMDQAKEAVNVLAIKLGTALLPFLTTLAGKATDLITNFTAWETKTHGVENAVGKLGDAFNKTAGFISNVITVGANIVGFFQHNQVAALALLIPLGLLGGALTYLGVTAVVAFIAAAPAMIAGFIAGAAAAWTMAAGVIAATWPFLLIGAAIGLVVAIIILAVTHWGDITKWLTGVWTSFTGWFMGLINGIGAWWSGVWKGMQGIGQSIWSGIVGIFQAGAHLLFLAIFGPIIAIVNLFHWLYDHNTYFKQLVDAIVGFFTAGFKWLTDQWTSFTGWLGEIWKGIHHTATIYWSLLVFAIQGYVSIAVNWLHGIWNNVASWFSGVWKGISDKATQAWQLISGIFGSAWSTYIAGPLGGIWNKFVGWLSGWGPQALKSGQNFISMLVSGITSGAGAIWNAVSGIAQNIWKALGFHSPAEAGPAHDADVWMPNLIKMFVSGLNAGVPSVQTAAQAVAQPLRDTLQYPIKPSATALAQASAAPRAASADGEQHIYIMLDSTQLAHVIGNKQARIIRARTGVHV